tara:strand:+ start:611 stop:742 length:132 start_codon:yes stop_codon:yes gene_type:complete
MVKRASALGMLTASGAAFEENDAMKGSKKMKVISSLNAVLFTI